MAKRDKHGRKIRSPGTVIIRSFMLFLVIGVTLLALASMLTHPLDGQPRLKGSVQHHAALDGAAGAAPAPGASSLTAVPRGAGLSGPSGAAAAAPLPTDSLYRLHAATNDGVDLDLGSLAGKVSLVVNVASH